MKSSTLVKLFKSRLSYKPDTGECIWIYKNKFHPRLYGRPAGSLRSWHGEHRVYIKVNRKLYPRARIAFIMMTGRIPYMVDHINGIPADDRWSNLREVNCFQNMWNIKLNKKSKIPLGVRLLPSGRFQARLTVYRKTTNLGTFETARQAHCAYLRRKRLLHGEYCRKEK